jgi:hypothetical protein
VKNDFAAGCQESRVFCFCICSSTPGPQLFLARATTLEIASFTVALALEAVNPTAATS